MPETQTKATGQTIELTCKVHDTGIDELTYGTAQRQRRKHTQPFCDLRVRIECNECVLSKCTSLDFRIL